MELSIVQKIDVHQSPATLFKWGTHGFFNLDVLTYIASTWPYLQIILKRSPQQSPPILPGDDLWNLMFNNAFRKTGVLMCQMKDSTKQFTSEEEPVLFISAGRFSIIHYFVNHQVISNSYSINVPKSYGYSVFAFDPDPDRKIFGIYKNLVDYETALVKRRLLNDKNIDLYFQPEQVRAYFG